MIVFMFPIWWWLHGVMVGMMLADRYKCQPHLDEELKRVIEKNRHRIIDLGN